MTYEEVERVDRLLTQIVHLDPDAVVAMLSQLLCSPQEYADTSIREFLRELDRFEKTGELSIW